jgi:hypothetical protein
VSSIVSILILFSLDTLTIPSNFVPSKAYSYSASTIFSAAAGSERCLLLVSATDSFDYYWTREAVLVTYGFLIF